MAEALTHEAPPATALGCEIDFRSDGVLILGLDDGQQVEVHLSQANALHLARGLLQFANPQAYASRMAATSREAGHG